MSNTVLRRSFDVLRRVLKTRGMTYADLANRLDVSEPTIKRLFVERDCKLSRLTSICQILDLSVSELLEIADRSDNSVLALSNEVEQALADSPPLFYFFLLLRDHLTPEAIGAIYSLEPSDLHLYCRDLENLGLLELSTNGTVTLLSEAPICLSLGGPLQGLYKAVNAEFLNRAMDEAVERPDAYVTISRRMRPESATLANEDVQAMVSRIRKLAKQDRLSYTEDELVTYKWAIACGRASFTTLFDIGPHKAKRQASGDQE